MWNLWDDVTSDRNVKTNKASSFAIIPVMCVLSVFVNWKCFLPQIVVLHQYENLKSYIFLHLVIMPCHDSLVYGKVFRRYCLFLQYGLSLLCDCSIIIFSGKGIILYNFVTDVSILLTLMCVCFCITTRILEDDFFWCVFQMHWHLLSSA
jgi:hypothetical protein